MGLSTYVGSFAISTGAAGTTQDITAPGFQPAFVIFWWNGQTASTDTVAAGNHRRGMGFAVSSTDRRCISGWSTDAAASSVCAVGQRVDHCIALVNSAGSGWDSYADYNGVITGGFQIIIDLQFSTAIRVHYLAIGGTDITNAATGHFQTTTSTGTLDVTTPGFQPTGGLLLCAGLNLGVAALASSGTFTVGAMRSTTERAFSHGSARGGRPTMDTWGASNDVSAMEVMTPNTTTIGNRIDFSSWLSNGFQVNRVESTSSVYYHYIVWKGGQFGVKSGLTQTDTTTTTTLTFGFQPAAGLVVGSPYVTGGEDATDTPHADDSLSIGAFTSASARQAMAIRDEDAAADSNVAEAVEYDEVLIHIDDVNDALEALMDVSSITSTAAVFIMDDADAVQNFFWCAAWAPAGAGAVTLTVQNGSHSQESTSPALSQASTLTVQNGTHNQESTSPSLGQASVLSGVGNGTHSHESTSPALSTAKVLAVQNGTHSQESTSPALAQANVLQVQSGTHSHESTSPALAQANLLAVQNGSHSHSADNVNLGGVPSTTLAIQNGTHTHSADSPALIQNSLLVVQNGTHTHSADSLTLVYLALLVVASGIHSHAASAPGLAQATTLTVQNGFHYHDADGPYWPDEIKLKMVRRWYPFTEEF